MAILEYTRTKQDVVNIILDLAQRKKQIIHGQQSLNTQLPKHLQRKTKDYDIYSKNPEQSAKELAEKLSKTFNKKFEVTKGIHKGTFKVKDLEGNTIADYTQYTKKPKSNLILGVRYADKKYAKTKLQKILRDENKKFRWDKDLETLEKLKQGEKNIW